MTSTNRRRTESFLVNKAGATTIPVSTTTLVNSSTGNVNLTDGQLGFVSVSPFGTIGHNVFTDATPTVAENPVIQIVQGTPYSAAVATSNVKYPLWVRPFEYSSPIDGRNKAITVTKQAFRYGKHSLWVIGKPSASATGQINILDETEYALHIAFAGRRVEYQYSLEQAASLDVMVTTPNFTNLSATYLAPKDWICQKLGYEINRNSHYFQLGARYQGSDPIIAFAVTDSASGDYQISALTVGTVINVFVYNGVTRTLTLTQEMLDTIHAAATASSFTYLNTINLSTAGTSLTKPATGLFVMALDANTAFIDYIPEIKNRIRVGLKRGFDTSTVSLTETVAADEGTGYGRQLELIYQATAGQRKYAQRHTVDPVIKFDSPIVSAQEYIVYNVLHGNSEQIDHANIIYSPFREIVCIPRYSSGTTTNAVIATFDTALNAFLASSGNAAIVSI